MSSQLEIRAALRLRKFRGTRKFQLSKKKVQHYASNIHTKCRGCVTRMFASHSSCHLSKQLVRSEKYESDGILHPLSPSHYCSM